MNDLLRDCLLLAERSPIDEMVNNLGSGFRERRAQFDTEQVVTTLVVGVGAVLLTWILAHLIQRGLRRLYHSPTWLFYRLCRAHKLSWSERWLLWQLARQQHLRDPAQLFVDPARLAPAQLQPGWEDWAAQLAELRNRLFAAPPAENKNLRSPGGFQSAGLTGSSTPDELQVPLFPITFSPALDIAPWTEGPQPRIHPEPNVSEKGIE